MVTTTNTRTSNRVTALFQLGAFSFFMTILGFIIYKPAYRFMSYDPRPFVIPNRVFAHQKPAQVGVGMHIRSFSRTDVLGNELGVEATVLFSFDEKFISRADIGKFTIEKGEILEKSEPVITQHGELTYAQYYVCARFKINPNYRSFPLDDHSVFIVITNQHIKAENAQFVAALEHFTKAPDAYIPNYKVERLDVETGFTETKLALHGHDEVIRHPRAVFIVECNRMDIRHFLVIFIPLVLIFFFTLFAFSISPETHGIWGVAIVMSGVPALISWRFVIETLSPNANYFMLSDYLFFLFLALVFVVFILAIDCFDASKRTKQAYIIALYMLLVLGCAALLQWML